MKVRGLIANLASVPISTKRAAHNIRPVLFGLARLTCWRLYGVTCKLAIGQYS
jgi:hypothetical protein